MDQGLSVNVDIWMWIIGQTIVISFAIFGAFLRIQVSVARLEGKVEVMAVQQGAANRSLEKNEEQHKDLAGKVDGISRALAMIEGMEMVRGKEHSG